MSPRAESRRAARQPPRNARAKPLASSGQLEAQWSRLHAGDREPWPQEASIAVLAKQEAGFASWLDTHARAGAFARDLQRAWLEFHAGRFRKAIELGSALGPLGASVANKAAAVDTLYAREASEVLATLSAAIERGEKAIELLPRYANAHYTLALVLGRYSQRISILRALATGLAGRVRTHLEKALELESHHAEAHVALGLYHAEIVSKLGAFAASMTYGASAEKALEHFRRAVRLAPQAPIVSIEYANGLLLIDADRYRAQARELYEHAAAFEPADAMELADVERARRGVP
jgi:tetratricopeptide (TPR) repeat protein